MDDETILALGECAIALRETPAYTLLTKLFEQQISTDLLTTQPKDTERREQLYHQLQGARAFHEFVATYADALEKLTKPEEPAVDQEDDPGVHDIYEN